MSQTFANNRINFRTDPGAKAQAESLFKALGLDLSSALNMFVKQAIHEQALPLRPSLQFEHNEVTLESMRHTQDIVDGKIADDGLRFVRVGSHEELFRGLLR